MSSTMNANTNDNFYSIVNAVATNPINPYTVSYKGRDVKFIFDHSADSSGVAIAVHSTYKCKACTSRAKRFCTLSDKNGQLFMPSSAMIHVADNLHKEQYTKMHDLSHAACRGDIRKIMFLNDSNLFKFDPMESGFNHFHINVPDEIMCDSSITPNEFELLEAAVNRYIIQGQMCRLIERLAVQGMDSCLILESCLQKVTYGDTFLLSLRWAKAILEDLLVRHRPIKAMSPKGRFTFYMKHLFNGTLAPDLSSGTVCFECQTLAQLVDLLETAKSEKAMMVICEERLNPLKYQRPTADASVGQVANAIKLLGDFTISVAKISTHSNAVPVGVKPSNESSAMSGFSAQMVAATKTKSTSFADRCGGSTLSSEIRDLKTVDDLVKLCIKHPDLDVMINTINSSTMYLAENTLSSDRLCVPFTWAFCGSSPSTWNMSGWMSISHIIPTWKSLSATRYRNVLFVIKNAKIPSDTKVNTFPEFLSSEYTRTCRTAYEGLKNTMRLEIPIDGPLAFGIGACTKDEGWNLNGSVSFRINGIEVSISRLA